MYPGIRAIVAIRDLRNSDVAGYLGLEWIFIVFSIIFGYFGFFYKLLSVLVSPSRVRVFCAACGASEPQEKTRPGFLENVPYGFY